MPLTGMAHSSMDSSTSNLEEKSLTNREVLEIYKTKSAREAYETVLKAYGKDVTEVPQSSLTTSMRVLYNTQRKLGKNARDRQALLDFYEDKYTLPIARPSNPGSRPKKRALDCAECDTMNAVNNSLAKELRQVKQINASLSEDLAKANAEIAKLREFQPSKSDQKLKRKYIQLEEKTKTITDLTNPNYSVMSSDIPAVAQQAVLVQSGKLPVEPREVKGYDFNRGVDHHALLQTYRTSGFQATNFGMAVEEISKMIAKKGEPMSAEYTEGVNLNPCGRDKSNCTIFLGYTSNMASCGVRDTICFLAQHNMVDVIVASAGGIEEDFIKCLAPTYLGDFALRGKELRESGINRIGNLLVPNDNYCKFEDWLMPILDTMLKEQKEQGTLWTPSKIVHRLGKEINDPSSIYYWCYKNNIPVFSPAITDGSLGDMIYFHSYKNPGLVIDLVEDIRRMNSQAVFAAHTGMIIVGGGLIKHHICNANLMRNGADFSVFLNTASEFDGSDSGARPDEAISWGKIKKDATPVKIYGEASLIFPLLVAETFARHHHKLDEPASPPTSGSSQQDTSNSTPSKP